MNRTLIIAEAGVNHNGDITLAKRLIDVAAEADADYVKFQTFKSDQLVSKTAKKADYQIENTKNNDESQLEMLQKLELSDADHVELIKYCHRKGISFFSTAFDLDSLDYLSVLGMDMVKIPSGEITNLPYLKKAASLFSKVILSTGMATIDEIDSALSVFLQSGISINDISILHCNTEYPTPFKDVNLMAMLQIKNRFGTSVGYSDHTLGIEVPIAAVALGASIIEKHFTLDKNMEGPDHKASLEPDELKAMVMSIRNIELSLAGTGIKEPSRSEKKNIAIVRKSIVAKKVIKKGQVLDESNLTVKRPGNGISPMKWDSIIGTVACRDFDIDDLIHIDE